MHYITSFSFNNTSHTFQGVTQLGKRAKLSRLIFIAKKQCGIFIVLSPNKSIVLSLDWYIYMLLTTIFLNASDKADKYSV